MACNEQFVDSTSITVSICEKENNPTGTMCKYLTERRILQVRNNCCYVSASWLSMTNYLQKYQIISYASSYYNNFYNVANELDITKSMNFTNDHYICITVNMRINIIIIRQLSRNQLIYCVFNNWDDVNSAKHLSQHCNGFKSIAIQKFIPLDIANTQPLEYHLQFGNMDWGTLEDQMCWEKRVLGSSW